MADLVAGRYGNALFSLAKDENKVEQLLNEVGCVLELFDENPELMAVITHPQVDSNEKFNLLKTSFQGKVDESLFGLFEVVFTKNREAYLPDILRNFVEKAREDQNITSVEICSPIELTSSQLEKIVTTIENKSGKKVSYTAIVDKSLLGGVRITIDGKVLDNTIKWNFKNLKSMLLA